MSRALVDAVALTPLQRGLYAVSMTAGEWDPYLVRFALRFEGIGDIERLRCAWNAMAARHPQLTGQIRTDGLPHPVLLMFDGVHPDWALTDARGEPDPAHGARQIYHAEGYRRIDLDDGPLMRLHAVRVADETYEIVCTAHHIVVDGWSIPIMVTDLVALYEAGTDETSDPLPAPVPLRHHAAWLADRDATESAQVWRDALEGFDEPAMIGGAAADLTGEPQIGEWTISAEDTEDVSAWARQHGLTLNTVTQLAWARIVSGLTGRDDVVFGQTTSGRDESLPGVQQIVGGLVTTIPVRVDVNDSSPAEAGKVVQRRTAQLRRHEYLGIADITRAAGVGQLFDTLLVFESAPTDGIIDGISLADGGRLIPHRVESPSHYPIAVVPVLDGDNLIVRVEVRPDMVARYPEGRLAQRVAHTILAMPKADRLCDTDILLPDEVVTILSRDHDPDPGGQRSVEQALLAAAHDRPDAVAVVDRAGEHTYTDFVYLARRMAWGLADAGVGRGDMVAVMLPRTVAVVAAPFAVALAGGICVHVDPDTPADRLSSILETSGARVVVAAGGTHERVRATELSGQVHCVTAEELLDASERALPIVDTAPEVRPLYVVFTSGTTGRPKGVVVSHQNLLQHWETHERRIFAPTSATLGRQLRVGHGWSTGFDAAWQPTVALLSGHAVVILDDETRVDAHRTVETIAHQGIDVFDTSPSMLTRLIDAGLFGDSADGDDVCSLSILALGGEAISPDTWQRLSRLAGSAQQAGTRVINFYGPTETTVEVFMATVADHAAPTLGYPFKSVRAQVLDHRLRPVPPGAQGELYISGGQTAVGYLGRPGLTSAAFVAAADGTRRYRTGDVVIRGIDDTVAFAGRVDDQVKINGYRVEPAEASAVLRTVSGVRHAEVLAFKERGRTRLGALVVSERMIPEIRADLVALLPAYLVPTRFVSTASIPLNSNDKVDVHAAIALLRAAVTTAVTPPSTTTERMVVDVVRELGPESVAAEGESMDIGMEHTLADLGIDSIGVMEVASRLRAAGFPLTARQVAGASDLGALARLADEPPSDEDPNPAAVPAGTLWPLSAVAIAAVRDGAPRSMVQLQAFRVPESTSAGDISQLLTELAEAHPTLRSRLDAESAQLVIGEPEPVQVLTRTRGGEVVDELVSRVDPVVGRMMSAALLAPAAETTADHLLVLMVHHLATDAVSWRVIAADLRALAHGETVAAESVPDISADVEIGSRRHGSPLGRRFSDPDTDDADRAVLRSIDVGVGGTAAILRRCESSGTPVADALLQISAVASAVTVGVDGRVAIAVEGHGRSHDDAERVGWFTVETTMLVDPSGETAAVPAEPGTAADTRLNYLGRLDRVGESDAQWSPLAPDVFAAEFGSAGINPLPLRHSVDIIASVVGGAAGPRLVAHIAANSAVFEDDDIDGYVQRWQDAARKYGARNYGPADDYTAPKPSNDFAEVDS